MLTIIIQDVHTDTMDIYPVDNTASIISEYDEHFTKFLTKDQRPEHYYSLLAYNSEVRPIKRSEFIRIYQGGELLDSVEFVERPEKPEHLKTASDLISEVTDYEKNFDTLIDYVEKIGDRAEGTLRQRPPQGFIVGKLRRPLTKLRDACITIKEIVSDNREGKPLAEKDLPEALTKLSESVYELEDALLNSNPAYGKFIDFMVMDVSRSGAANAIGQIKALALGYKGSTVD
ncbi:hypothetical protein S1R3X_000011 [Vibrio phage vB_ValS_VA-RY-4]|nr:hypothetical protein S1R3X_000011 [Vibrio phage vB_ValS_VA-RY-4]CAH0448193.1 hypothetical protein SM030_00060 [Vibrio phage vB_VpaS_sm030]CAI5930169.1 hypothetical protein SM031_00060 [Vibrio phage vB_VpaS_sm030]CAI6013122.1 hypothetical protein SM032_00060 [Vibrio phage vB_VpaS_sm030]